MQEIQVGSVTFQVTPLKVAQALKAQAILLEAVVPGFVAAGTLRTGLDIQALRMAVGGLERLGELVSVYAEVCKVQREGTFLPLKAFLDLTFERQTSLLLAWVLAVTEYQFADFFGGSGLSLLTETASRCGFLNSLTGASGD